MNDLHLSSSSQLRGAGVTVTDADWGSPLGYIDLGAFGISQVASMLSIPSGPALNLVAGGGTPQSTAVNQGFASALQAIVKDSSGRPVNGAVVTFTTPSSGPSAVFSGSTIAT